MSLFQKERNGPLKHKDDIFEEKLIFLLHFHVKDTVGKSNY